MTENEVGTGIHIPARINRDFLDLKFKLRHYNIAPTITFDGARTWIISLEDADSEDETFKLSIIYKTRERKNPKKSFKGVIDGEEKDFADLISMLNSLQGRRKGTQGSSPVEGTAAATGHGSVQVRRASVIRN